MLQVVLGCLSLLVSFSSALGSQRQRIPFVSPDNVFIPAARPPVADRKFASRIIEDVIHNVSSTIRDRNLAVLFSNCFPNTLDTTVQVAGPMDTFIITGDIQAMWLRDSTNQVLPYLRFATFDEKLKGLFQGLVLRQLRSILIDPYANAFNVEEDDGLGESLPRHNKLLRRLRGRLFGEGHQWDVRNPPMRPAVFEGKFELDSLCSVLELLTETAAALSPSFLLPHMASLVLPALETMMDVLLTQQQQQMPSSSFSSERGRRRGGNVSFSFWRVWEQESYPRRAVNVTGLIRSAFRPSDDETYYDFHIPSNIVAAVMLRRTAALLERMLLLLLLPTSADDAHDSVTSSANELTCRMRELADTVDCAVTRFGSALTREVLTQQDDGKDQSRPAPSLVILAYEVDGLGHRVLMDDANMPSLLSVLPLLANSSSGVDVGGIRRWLLSPENPYYFNGTQGAGIGSPHTGQGMIWPMSVMVQAMTSDDDDEILRCLSTLVRSADGTGFMHESFHKDNVRVFTRKWFAWANSVFGMLLLNLLDRKPHLLG